MTENVETIGQALSLGLGAIYGYLVGLNYKVFLVLTLLMAIDVIVGVLLSFVNGEFKSSLMKRGLIVKVLIILLLLAVVVFQLIISEYGLDVPFANTFAGMLAFMEMFSIVESFLDNGIALPKGIVEWFNESSDNFTSGGDK